MKILKGVGFAAIILILIGAVAFFTIVPNEVAKRMNPVVLPPPYDASERAARLHQKLFIADLHADSSLWNRNLLDYGTYGHGDIPRFIKSNVALQVFTAVTKSSPGPKDRKWYAKRYPRPDHAAVTQPAMAGVDMNESETTSPVSVAQTTRDGGAV